MADRDVRHAAADQLQELLQRQLHEGAITDDPAAQGGLVVRFLVYMDVRGINGEDFYFTIPAPDTTRRDNVDLTLRGALGELVDWIAAAVKEELADDG